MNRRKRLLTSLLLTLAMIVMMIPVFGVTVSTASSLPNFKVTADGILSWKHATGVKTYYIHGLKTASAVALKDESFTNYDCKTWSGEGVVFDLQKYMDACGDYEEKTYELKVNDQLNYSDPLNYESTFTFIYNSKIPKLNTPQNLRWEGKTIRWDPVSNAGYYKVVVYYLPGGASIWRDQPDSSITSEDLSHPSSWTEDSAISFQPEGKYYFGVQAFAKVRGAYRDSDIAESEIVTGALVDKGYKTGDSFQVIVLGGTADKSTVKIGEKVTISATKKDGYTFSGWEVVYGGIALENKTSATTTFTMPNDNVSIKANYTLNVTHVVEYGSLNIRSGPGTEYSRIGGITAGTEVAVVEIQGEWSRIVYESDYGWVQSKYLTSLNEYGISVANGYSSVSKAKKGETVTISYTGPKSIVKQDMTQFDHWEVTSGNVSLADPNSKVTTFVMPAGNVIVVGVYKNKEEVKSNPFVDISETDPYYDAVLWAYYADPQITNGMDETHFGPDLTVTRGQAVTFLWRSQCCPEPTSYTNPFEDVSSTEYYYKPILWAVEKGITKGVDDTHFNPMGTLSTQHIITFLFRTTYPGKDGWDGDAAVWAADEKGRPFGIDIAVNNETDCPRCHVVQFLYCLSK